MGYGDMNGNESAKGQGFDNNPQNINKNGASRKTSVTKYLKQIIKQTDGYVLKADLVKDCNIEDKGEYPELTIKGEWEKVIIEKDGVEEVKRIAVFKIELPNAESIAIQWAIDSTSKHSKIRTRSRETLLDRTEGKAKQSIDVTDKRPIKTEIDVRDMTPEKVKEYMEAVKNGEE